MLVRLTRAGFEKMKAELKHLKTVKRPEIIKALAEARAHGDLSENAEYDSAKEAQHQLEIRISELESKLTDVQILDDQAIDKDKVYLGAKVSLKDLDKGKEIFYTIVSKEEADFKTGKISFESPVGKQLLGKKPGDIVEIAIPAGKMRYEVMKIDRE